MWKKWKTEIAIISVLVALVLVVTIPVVISNRNISEEVYLFVNYHVMVDDTIYWRSTDVLPYVAELPEGAEQFAKVEVEVDSQEFAEVNGQANGFSVGTPLCRIEACPGIIYAKDQDGRWNRMVEKELQQTLLRYNEKLYIYVQSSIPERDLNISYKFIAKQYSPTGETVCFDKADTVPLENGVVNSRIYDGHAVYLNPEQNDMLALVSERANGSNVYFPFIQAESIGLDYSEYEGVLGTENNGLDSMDSKQRIYDIENLSFKLPEGLKIGEYDQGIEAGGYLLLPYAYCNKGDFAPEYWKSTGAISCFLAKDSVEWDNDDIVGVNLHANHTSYEEIGPIDNMFWPAYLLKAEHDLMTAAELSEYEEIGNSDNIDVTSGYWYVVFAKPEEDFGFLVSLATREYTKEEMIDFVSSFEYAVLD